MYFAQVNSQGKELEWACGMLKVAKNKCGNKFHVFMCVRMAERSKAPDSSAKTCHDQPRHNRAFWSTHVIVGSNPTPDNKLQKN